MEKANRRAILGIVFILIGTVILLDNLYIIDIPRDVFTWQMIIVAIGLFQVVTGNYRSGLIVMAIGGFLWFIQYERLNFRDYWPIILIIIGISFFLRSRKSKIEGSDGASYIDDMAIFAGNKKRITSDQFSGGKVTCAFGGVELDLRDAQLDNGHAVIDAFTAFGGLKVYVPDDWVIKSEITPILGGFDDKRMEMPNDSPTNTLVLKGMVLFGGVEVSR